MPLMNLREESDELEELNSLSQTQKSDELLLPKEKYIRRQRLYHLIKLMFLPSMETWEMGR